MQPARGTVHTVGRITICDNYPQDFHDDLNFYNVDGAIIEMVDEQTTRAGAMLLTSVEVWPACAADLAPEECTHENYAHLKQRLAAAADNLAREVRSNQAATLVRADLEERVTDLTQGLQNALVEKGELLNAFQAERGRLLEQVSEMALMGGKMAEANASLSTEVERLAGDLADMTASRDKYERKMNEWAQAHSDLREAHKSVVADNDRLLDMVNDRDAKVLALSLDNDRRATELAEVLSELRQEQLAKSDCEG